MKDQKQLTQEIVTQFIQSHPEMAVITQDSFYFAMITHARTYAIIAIEFTVKQVLEEIAMEKKTE